MLEWIGDREAEFFSWSETDYYQIRGEILSFGFSLGDLLKGIIPETA